MLLLSFKLGFAGLKEVTQRTSTSISTEPRDRTLRCPIFRTKWLCFGCIWYSGMEVWACSKACVWEEGYVGMSRNKLNSENPFCYPAPVHHSSNKSFLIFLNGTILSHATNPDALERSSFHPCFQGWAWLSLSQSMHCILLAILIIQRQAQDPVRANNTTQRDFFLDCWVKSKFFRFLLGLNLEIGLEANDSHLDTL